MTPRPDADPAKAARTPSRARAVVRPVPGAVRGRPAGARHGGAAAGPDSAVRSLFGGAEQIGPGQVVRFSSPSRRPDSPGSASTTRAGASCAARPPTPPRGRRRLPLDGNGDRLPEWSRIDAGVRARDGDAGTSSTTRRGTYLEVARHGGRAVPRADRRSAAGAIGTPLTDRPASVDGPCSRAAARRSWSSGTQYFRYPTGRFDEADAGYPRRLADNHGRPAALGPDRRGVPRHRRRRVLLHPPAATATQDDRARTGLGHGAGAGQPQGLSPGRQDEPRRCPTPGACRSPVDAAFVDGADGRTFVFAGDQYVRFSGSTYERPDAGYPRRIADQIRRRPAAPVAVGARCMTWSAAPCWCSTTTGTGRPRTGAAASRCRSAPTAPSPPYELVETAWLRDGYLYLVLTRPGRVGSGSPPVAHLRRFILDDDGFPPSSPTTTTSSRSPRRRTPRSCATATSTCSAEGSYGLVPAGRALDGAPKLVPVGDLWVDLPRRRRGRRSRDRSTRRRRCTSSCRRTAT